MELQLQNQEKLIVSSSDSSEEDDDNEDENNEEYDKGYSPDILGDLELKDLDEETCNFLSSIFCSNDLENDPVIKPSRQKNANEIVQAPAVSNGEELNIVDEGVEDDEDEDIDSEEEKNILQGIKEEIETKVREEMKEELDGFQARLQALESEIISDVQTDEEMNPKLREAIIKMNKLDTILKKKVKQEREVKKERMLLERRIRKELYELEQGGSQLREIKLNAEKFLSLELPQSHNEGIKIDGEEGELPPVFQTQIDEDLIKASQSGNNKTGERNDTNNHHVKSGRSTSEATLSSTRQSDRSSTSMSKNQSKKSKNFIKRNKKLASQAEEPIAMTDDEKKRLKELLEGIDDMPDLDSISDIEGGQLQLSLVSGEGYCPDSTEKVSLVNIHEKLKQIMSEEEYNSIMSTSDPMPGQATPQMPMFTRVGVKSFSNVEPGENILFETKEERELNTRLQAIEKDLEKFKLSQEMEEDMERHLTDEQLDKLLNDCVRNLSRTSDLESPDSTPRSQLSSRQHFLEHPPKLSEEQLQQLLSEAHFPMSSKLLAIREHDGDSQDEDDYFETISADTWKAIKDAQPFMADRAENTSISGATCNKPNLNKKSALSTQEQAMLNKNMSANNDIEPQKSFSSESYKYNSWSGPRDYFSGSAGVMSFDSNDSNIQQSLSDSACWKSSEEFKRFPKISKSCIDFTADISRGSTPLSSLSLDNSEIDLHTVRLPLLSSSSFLIHAQQGMSAEEMKYKNVTKKPNAPIVQSETPGCGESNSESENKTCDYQI